MASLPAQVIYAPPLTMQERLPSIRDLDFPVRPPRQQQSQSQSQQQQLNDPSSSQSHNYGRSRAQTMLWATPATTMPPPASPASTSGHGGPLSAPPTNTGIPLPPTIHPSGVHSRDELSMQDSHTQSRQRSESRASATRTSMSPSTGRVPHSTYLPRQYSGQHGVIYYSSVPPSPHQSHLQHPQQQQQQLPPSPSQTSPVNTSQIYHSQGPPNYAPVQPAPPSGYASYHAHYASAPPQHPSGPLPQPQQAHSQQSVSSPTGLSPGLYQTDHWQQQQQHQGIISHSSGHSSPHSQQHSNQVAHQSHQPHPAHLQQHSHHHATQVHQSPHQTLQQLQQQPSPSQSQSHAFDHSHESTLGGVTDITPSTGEASRPPDTTNLSESFTAEHKIEMRRNYLKEITENCYVIVRFSDHYHQASVTSPHIQPDPEELAEMRQKAGFVVSLLEELRKLSISDVDNKKDAEVTPFVPVEGRPPKRPWEDTLDENENLPSQVSSFVPSGGSSQTMAEKDMAIIRSKRATNPASIPSDAPKGKYRKRSRASPPGKCHSCHIRETPEWRRGPDGARTLCNACGLHYAKLMRKREKAGPDGRPVHIDLETLRASTRMANEKEKSQATRQKRQQESGDEQTSPPPEKRQSNISSPEEPKLQSPTGQTYSSNPGTAPGNIAPQNVSENVEESSPTNAPPVWSSNQSSRGYTSEQQSYMRNTPSHPR